MVVRLVSLCFRLCTVKVLLCVLDSNLLILKLYFANVLPLTVFYSLLIIFWLSRNRPRLAHLVWSPPPLSNATRPQRARALRRTGCRARSALIITTQPENRPAELGTTALLNEPPKAITIKKRERYILLFCMSVNYTLLDVIFLIFVYEFHKILFVFDLEYFFLIFNFPVFFT